MPEVPPDAVTALVADAVEMGVCSVCVPPSQLPVPHPSSVRIAAGASRLGVSATRAALAGLAEGARFPRGVGAPPR